MTESADVAMVEHRAGALAGAVPGPVIQDVAVGIRARTRAVVLAVGSWPWSSTRAGAPAGSLPWPRTWL